MRLSAGHAVLAVLLTLVVVKLSPLPVAVLIVPTGSMYPTIKPGDLVVVWGRGFHVGDIVVWCVNPVYCVVHRVVNVSDGMVQTKGDANPLPDRPVPIRLVKGRVVAVVPRSVWVPSLAAVASAWGLLRLRRSIRRAAVTVVSPYYLASMTLMFYIVLTLSMPLLYTSMSAGVLGYIHTPKLELRSLRFTEACSIIISYNSYYGLLIEKVDKLLVNDMPASAVVVNGTTLIIHPDPKLIARVVEAGEKLRIELNAKLTRMGYLLAEYNVVPPFRPLKFSAENNTLVIVNPNCYPYRVNVTIAYAERPGPYTFKTYTLSVTGRASIRLPESRYVYVDITYLVAGHRMHQRIVVRG